MRELLLAQEAGAVFGLTTSGTRALPGVFVGAHVGVIWGGLACIDGD